MSKGKQGVERPEQAVRGREERSHAKPRSVEKVLPIAGPYQFEPHGGFGTADPDGEPWPVGYINCSLNPIFELRPLLVWEPGELEATARMMAHAPELARCLRNMISALDAARSDMAELFARKIEATREAACAALAALAPDDASLGRHTGSEALGSPQSPPSQPEEGQ